MSKNKPTKRFLILMLLLCVGLASSLYLTNLFVRVHHASGDVVESFCAVSERVNCVTVADSKYSTVLGIPISVYGVEFYLVAIVILLLSYFAVWPWREWQSYLFWLTAASLPVCAMLGYISAALIRSLCIMCLLVYAVNLASFVILIALNRRRFRDLIFSGPKELFLWIFGSPRHLVVGIVIALVLLSQFIWLPFLFASTAHSWSGDKNWRGLPVEGLSVGPLSAPVQIEEFTDFECPFCGKAHRVIMELLGKYPGKIRLRHRDLPLDMACNPNIRRPYHGHACLAARYARCAARQRQYWPYEEMLFTNRHSLRKSNLDRFAQELKLDMGELQECLGDREIGRLIREDISEARRRDISGTPTFFINGERVVGYKPLSFWEEKVASILGK